MSHILNSLLPDFKEKIEIVLGNCLNRGVEMRPNEGLRDPLKQARYWRQSRTTEEIRTKILQLRNKDSNFLADCLESVGPQYGDHVTDAIPGLSWHQWGEAIDCYWVVNGRASWDLNLVINGLNGYMVYADEARNLGLNAGYFWRRFKDAPHIQLRDENSPAKLYSYPEIDHIMETRFKYTTIPQVPATVIIE